MNMLLDRSDAAQTHFLSALAGADGRADLFDVAIIGAGLAGSAAAIILGRAGYRVALVDAHDRYPPDFRAEKLTVQQLNLLSATGLWSCVMDVVTPIDDLWIARCGKLVEKRRNVEFGFHYHTLVNALRDSIPRDVTFVHGKVHDAQAGPNRQVLELAGGGTIAARLLVVSTGHGQIVPTKLGISRAKTGQPYCLSLGFTLSPTTGSFDFAALTYHGESLGDGAAYLTLFPIGDAMRANLFVYRGAHEDWTRRFRTAPLDELFALMPGLAGILPPCSIVGPVVMRPTERVACRNVDRDGVVMIGDAYATACPTTGTGVAKVLTDVMRLCQIHVPDWLATPGMTADKIGAFYDDPVKIACDRDAVRKAAYARNMALHRGPTWHWRRWRNYAMLRLRHWARSRFIASRARPVAPSHVAVPSDI